MIASTDRVQKIVQGLAAQGKLVEAGFSAMRSLIIPPDAPVHHVAAMRVAFFAGASHVFHSMMTMPDAGDEPTDADLARMAALQAELGTFEAAFAKHLPTRGTA